MAPNDQRSLPVHGVNEGSGTRISVEIVDDQFLFAQALASFVDEQPGFEVVGIAVTGPQALGIAKERQPDIVLLDFHLPGVTADVLLPRLKALAPATKVIVLTSDTTSAARLSAKAAGAEGFLTKETAIEEVVEAIRNVLGAAAPAAWAVADPGADRSGASQLLDSALATAATVRPRRRRTDAAGLSRRESDGTIVELADARSFLRAMMVVRRLEAEPGIRHAWLRSFDGSRATIRIRASGNAAEVEAAVRSSAGDLHATIRGFAQ